MKAKIQLNGDGFGKVVIDGIDVSNWVRELRVISRAGQRPLLQLDIFGAAGALQARLPDTIIYETPLDFGYHEDK